MTQTDKSSYIIQTQIVSTLMGNPFHCLLNKGQIPNLALKVLIIIWPRSEFEFSIFISTLLLYSKQSRTNCVLYACFMAFVILLKALFTWDSLSSHISGSKTSIMCPWPRANDTSTDPPKIPKSWKCTLSNLILRKLYLLFMSMLKATGLKVS